MVGKRQHGNSPEGTSEELERGRRKSVLDFLVGEHAEAGNGSVAFVVVVGGEVGAEVVDGGEGEDFFGPEDCLADATAHLPGGNVNPDVFSVVNFGDDVHIVIGMPSVVGALNLSSDFKKLLAFHIAWGFKWVDDCGNIVVPGREPMAQAQP